MMNNLNDDYVLEESDESNLMLRDHRVKQATRRQINPTYSFLISRAVWSTFRNVARFSAKNIVSNQTLFNSLLCS